MAVFLGQIIGNFGNMRLQKYPKRVNICVWQLHNCCVGGDIHTCMHTGICRRHPWGDGQPDNQKLPRLMAHSTRCILEGENQAITSAHFSSELGEDSVYRHTQARYTVGLLMERMEEWMIGIVCGAHGHNRNIPNVNAKKDTTASSSDYTSSNPTHPSV